MAAFMCQPHHDCLCVTLIMATFVVQKEEPEARKWEHKVPSDQAETCTWASNHPVPVALLAILLLGKQRLGNLASYSDAWPQAETVACLQVQIGIEAGP